MVSYEGIFFEADVQDFICSLEKKALSKVNDEIHCTFKYHPTRDEIFNELVGKCFEVYLIGYGNDGKNSGFEIALPNNLKKYYINFDEQNRDILKKPHITTSLKEGAKATDTKNLDFKPLKNPIKLIGRFGFWIKNENSEYVSYEPYQIK